LSIADWRLPIHTLCLFVRNRQSTIDNRQLAIGNWQLEERWKHF